MKIKNLKVLNKKQTKVILGQIKEQWDADINLDSYAVLTNEKEKVYIVKRDVFDIEIEKLRINSLGIYFCELKKGIRLSIEGSQLVGPKAQKNIAKINNEQAQKWIRGEDIKIKQEFEGFVIIKHETNYIGSGKFKEGTILNFVPKVRRLNI